MGVISVSGPQYGQLYNINIAGDAPTPDEQQRINQWVGQQEQLLSSQIQERFGAPAVQAEAPVAGEQGDDSTAIGRGFRRGIENVQSLFGTALEEAGKGVGLKGLETYGRELEQESEADLRKLDALARTTRRDVEGVGTGLSYVGEVASEQAPILATTLGGAGTGAAIGSMFGPLGTAAGAVIGGAAASFPLLFGGNVQRQEEQVAAGELDKVDIERALIAAGGQAAIEGIAGKVLALMPLKPGIGSLWARARKGAVAGAGTEIPTEVTQQLIERAQAGLPIDNNEAIQEYIDAGVAAGILGGGIGTVGGGFRKDQSKIELDQDLAETDPDLAEAPPPGTLLLEAPEPEITVAAEQAVTPEPVALLEQGVDPYAAEGFTINEYNAVLEQIINDGELLFPKAQAAIRERTGRKTVPTQVVRQIASVLEREGKISKSKRAKLDRYTPTPINQRAQEEIDILRRDTNNTLDAIRKITKTLPRLELDLRYAEQVGKDTSGKTTTADAARKKLQDKEVLLNKLNERLQRNQERLRSVNQDFNVPVSEKIGLPATQIRMQDFIEADRLRQQEELQRAREAADARAAADVVRQRKDEKVEVRTESYTTEQGKILEELKRRLLGLGLKDVRLEGRAAVRDDAGNMGYEGASYTSPEGDQVIALSMGIYRPDLDQNAYVKRLGDVMNHEIIHAVRNLGLFTKKELELLSKAARKTNYVKTADGKTVKRNYTYFDRAQRINPELSVKKDKRGVLSALEEEAIAEMFRDYTAGKLTKIGQSRSLLKRIGDFFRSIVGAHVDNGFNSVDKIFGGLNEGAVGARQRSTAEDQIAAKPSRIPNANLKSFFDAMGEEGALLEFPTIGQNINKYIYDVDRRALNTAIRSDEYPVYADVLRSNLDRAFPGNKIPVSRTEGYADLRPGPEGRPKTFFDVDKKDVLFAGYDAENELIVRGPQGEPMSVRVESPPQRVVRPQSTDVEVQSAIKMSRLPAVEEEIVPLQNIRMPLDMSMPPDQIRAQLQRMTNQNRPLVKNLINRIDQRFGTKSGDNVKDLSKVTQKARRPSILSVKPWHDVSHIRDSYRFKTIIDDFRNVPAIFNELLRDGISLVKIDTNKLFQPKEWGWRIIAFDLRMPNGQLVEWYLPLRELEAEKKSRGHLIFEEWRNKTQEQLARMQDEYFDAIGRSYRYYDQAFEAALDRMGISRQDAEASWRSAESSMLEAARNARNSSGFGISSGAKTPTGLMEPSAVRTALEPSSMNMTARDVPSSIRANASSDIGVTPSDIDVTGIPLEQQPKFSRVARSPAVGGLSNFIKNNPDGFTISPDTYEPVSGGYVVAPLKEAEIIVGKTLPEEVLLDYIQDNKDIARAVGKPVYLGGWFDSESGQYFLDNTLNVPTLEEALYIAEAAEQLAVFDLNNFEEVRTDEGIRRLQQSGAYSDNTAIGYKRRLEEIGRRFAEARNNRNAIEKEQLVGRVEAPKPYISEQAIKDTSPDQSFFDAVNKIPEKKRFSRISTPDGPLLSDDNNTGVQRFTVFRLGDDQDLNNKNAADINGLYMFIDMMDEKFMGYADKLTQYTVEVDGGFSEYSPLRNSEPPKIYAVYDESLGRNVYLKDPIENTTGSVGIKGDDDVGGAESGYRWYSFPAIGENKIWRTVGQPKVYSLRELLRNADAWTNERGGSYAKQSYGVFGAAMANQLYPNTQYAKEVERWLANLAPAKWAFDDELGTIVAKAVDQKFSRLTIPLTPEQRDASILDYLDPNTGKPLFNAKQGAETLVSFANKLLGLRNTRSYDIVNSEQDREDAARVFAAEAEAALLSSSDAIGWYDATLKLAKRVLSIRYPEISPVLFDGSVNPEFDPDAEVAFDFATAVTSNGLAVTDNYDFAANQYEALRGSEDGKFPVKGKGKQGSSMHAAFEFWNILTDQGYSPVQINDLLMKEARRNQIDDITASVLGVDKKDLPKKLIANTSEGAREMVSVAYLLGPKIGNGFYRNLRGNFDPITMDRWWMRFINRITGNPIKNVSDERIEKNIDGIWDQIQNQDLLQELDKEILALASARLDTKRLKRSDMQDLIPIMNDIYESDFYKKAYNDKIEQLEAEGYSRADAQTRNIAAAARPERTPFLKNVGTYIDNITTQLQEDPRGVKDRAAMRDLTARAKRILQDALGVEITNADMQALMWYAEKRIFAAGGVRRGRGQDNDYTDGAIYVLKKRGVNDDKIKGALPDSERYRVGVIDDELKADDQANAATVAVEPAREGDFFGPRRLSLEERGLYEDLTVEEQALAEQDLSEIDLGDRPPVMFSRIPTAPYKAVRSPVQGGGILDYAYGFISEAGRKVPVILPEGSHKEFDNGTEVGQGLYHIHRRMHDKELIENSKYKRVENAIYDLMRRWQNQGFDNGDSVVSYLSRDGGLTLEWRNNLAFSAPPLQLVLERKKVKDVPIYFVKTFFPILDKKDRAYVPKRGVKRAAYEARYSRIPQYARVGQTATPFIGPSDLAARAESIRYTKVQDIMAKYLAKVPFISDRTAQEKTEAFMTKLQDSMLPVGKMYDKLRERYGPNVITQDMDAYFQESLMHGVAGPKKEKFDRTSFRPVLEQVANMTVTNQENAALERMSGYYRDIVEKHKNKSHALANAYLYALHAKERNARISQISNGKIQNGSGMSNAEANNIIGFVDSLSPIKRDTLRNIDRQVQDMIKQTNEVYIEGGLIPDYLLDEDIDDDVRAQFEKYGNYVPLRGYADPEADLDVANDRVLSSTNRLGAKGKPNPYALGRTSYAGDILANVAVQHHQAIDKAERNKVGQSLLKLLERDDIDTSEFGRVLDEHPVKRVMVNGTIRYVPDRDFNDPDAPILAVRRGGKEYLLLLDPKIATSMKGTLSPKQANASVRFLHNITRFYANLLTSYNPAFLLSNWPRDIETAIFNAQQYDMKGSSKDIIKNVPKAFASILKTVNGKEGGDPYWINRYKEFYENGGQNVLNQMSNLMSASQDIQGTIRDIVGADNQGLTQKVKNGFIGKGASVLSYIEALNTAVENSTRLAFFDRMASELSAQGVPQKEALRRAAFAARNLTTNFAKGGEYKNGLNSLYLFFNASMQGSMAIFNSLANSKKARKLAGSIVVMGFLMDQINAALSDEDEATGIKNYDDISEYTLGHNLILPDLNGDGNYVKIPMAYGLNTLFNFGRITSNLIRGAMGTEGTYTPSQAGKELVGYVTEMINPFGGNSPLTFLSPTVGDLPIELLTNNDFRDAPIYKELSPYQPYLSRSGLYWSTTSPSAVWISKFINDTVGGGDDYVPGEILGMRVDIQPDVIEHIFGFMTGGVGRLLSQTVDTATSNIPNAAMGQWESDMIKTTPFLNKFLTAVTDKDRSSDYYDKRDDVFAVRRSFRAALEDGDRQQALAIRQKNPEIVRVMEPINKIDSAITKLRKRLKMIKSSKQIGEAQRKELIDKVEDRIYLLQSRGIQLMRGI